MQKLYYEKNREAIIAKTKGYRAANKDKINAYYIANKEKIKARKKLSSKKRYEKNKDMLLQNNREYVGLNKEKIRVVKRVSEKAWYYKNREKILAQKKLWAEKNPEKVALKKDRKLAKQYGIEIGEFAKMAEAQGYKCAACGTDKPGGKGNWQVDHCHKTDKVRGLLCFRCNITLGLINDDTAILEGLSKYLGGCG